MLRRCAGPVALVLLSSCGSSEGPRAVVAPKPPIDTVSVIVSTNPADHPDFLCTGVQDDIPINQAIQSADSSSRWTVHLMPGTYHVLHGIMVTSRVTLTGSGPNTIIRLEDNAPSMLSTAGIVRAKDDTQGGAGRRVQNVTIEDLVVDGNRAHQAPSTEDKKFGFYAEGDHIVMRRLVAMNCEGYGFDPHAHSDSIATTDLLLEDCESFGNALDGFTLDMVRNSTFRRNYAHDNDRHGINLVTASSDVTLSNSRSIHNGATGLMAQNGTRDVVIQSCEFASNTLQGMFFRDADGCSLLGNSFRDNARSGLLLRLSDHTTVSGNTFSENDPGSAGRAVVQMDSSTVNSIASNTIASTKSRYGVMESGTSDFNDVKDNVFTVPSQTVLLIGPHSSQSGNQSH